MTETNSEIIAANKVRKRFCSLAGAQRNRVFALPLSLQDSRHTAGTWLDHAGVSPKVASVFMGHKAPKRQPDAAPITLHRYTHVLPGELERARDQLDAFLVERAEEEKDASFKLAVAA